MNTNNLLIQGEIIEVLPPVTTPKGYVYQQLAVKQNHHKYSNIIAVSVWDAHINQYKIGDKIKAGLVIEARKTESGCYYSNKVSAWYIEKIDS
jgi:hypothetical protein